MSDSTLKVYKASAGSGKTYRLVVEYLKLIIQNTSEYASILAVTFTNKATTEMKTRILTELFGISNGLEESESYLKTIQKELSEGDEKWSYERIKKQAGTALNLMLHDYSRFRIETIDSFFQSILRNLAKELGLGAYMNIEIKEKPILQEAIQQIFAKVKDDQDLLKWISEYIDEKIDNGSDWKLSEELESFGSNIFREDYKEKEKEITEKLKDKKYLKLYKEVLYKTKETRGYEILQCAQQFRDICEKNSIETDDFLYGNSGVANYFNKILDKEDFFNEMGARTIACLDSPEKWAKKGPMHDTIVALAESHFIDILKHTEELRQNNSKHINTCNLILKHINKVGLLYDIAQTVRDINNEDNRFMLADTPNLLNELIDNNDAPFIYEKIGATLRHIMIDEFQDTSSVQWKNFKPLLMEGLSQNAMSLIVGDQKQSIYRWRNGDWRILGNLDKELPKVNIDVIPLKTNWRSEFEIIQFNNRIFQASLQMINLYMGDENQNMRKAYSDVTQECSKKEKEGHVSVEFITGPKEDYYENTLIRLVEKIEELQSQGIRADEITILVRKNKSIPMIAEYLSDYKKANPEKPYNYDVISDEAYRLDSSVAIQMIIQALKYIAYPENPIYQAQLSLSYQTEIGKKDISQLAGQIDKGAVSSITELEVALNKAALLPLYEMVEDIYRIMQLDTLSGQESYMYSFLDGINDFLIKKSSDIQAFLTYWDSTLCVKTIPFSSEINGIKIMSIHKSKGLEFHTVIVPFCDWTLTFDSTLSPLLWCSTDEEPYAKLPLLPIKYGKDMEESIFNKEFNEETEQLIVDNLNVLYVALTRAEKNMIIFGQNHEKKEEKEDKKKKDDNKMFRNVSDLMLTVLKTEEAFNNGWDEEKGIYTSGELYTKEKKEKGASANKLNKKPEALRFNYYSYKQKALFRQSNRSKDFINNEENDDVNSRYEYINRGNLLHQLFSNICSLNDIQAAADKLLFEGAIKDEEEKQKLIAFVKEAIEKAKVSQWFTEGIRLFNECELIFHDENGKFQVRRPDRVMQNDDLMTIVDFKFGKKNKRHEKQINEYKTLISQMGYKTQGYIWYVEDGVIVGV
ncbi:MAG TPA: UvrD-helicase domain-containing protein [Paludibacteraceae bacterium]|nr:UvrD-helicase domain-containing protein [Paludibacteraceae bacterium]HQF50341.1 UvrD-helicase domain-containing protein [Paludibacteraceae bacterium]